MTEYFKKLWQELPNHEQSNSLPINLPLDPSMPNSVTIFHFSNTVNSRTLRLEGLKSANLLFGKFKAARKYNGPVFSDHHDNIYFRPFAPDSDLSPYGSWIGIQVSPNTIVHNSELRLHMDIQYFESQLTIAKLIEQGAKGEILRKAINQEKDIILFDPIDAEPIIFSRTDKTCNDSRWRGYFEVILQVGTIDPKYFSISSEDTAMRDIDFHKEPDIMAKFSLSRLP